MTLKITECEVEIDIEGGSNFKTQQETLTDLTKDLPEQDCRYGLYTYKESIIFIVYTPV